MLRQQMWQLLVDSSILWAVFFTLIVAAMLTGFATAADWIGHVVDVFATAMTLAFIDWWLTKKQPDDGSPSANGDHGEAQRQRGQT